MPTGSFDRRVRADAAGLSRKKTAPAGLHRVVFPTAATGPRGPPQRTPPPSAEATRADPAGPARARQGLWLPTARQGIAQHCPERGKLCDDRRDQGKRISEDRVARLTSQAGVAAQIGYRRRPGRYGGKPAVVTENTLEPRFEAPAPDRIWVLNSSMI